MIPSVFAPAADVPADATQSAFSIDGLALSAGVNLSAGTWLPYLGNQYKFVYSDVQVYLDSGAVIDVSGSREVTESVSENIVAVQLRGTELADSPLQHSQVTGRAVVARVLAVAALAATLIIVGWAARQVLDRRRLAAWDAAWLATGWGHGFLLWLSLSAAAALLERISKREAAQPAAYFTEHKEE